MLTPLGEDGRVALTVLEQLTELFVSQGLGGLYVTGSTGQWPLFTVEERCLVVERVIRSAAGRIPVMVHVGAAATADAVTLARHAERAGAHAVSAVTPIYYAHSADAVFEYYREIGSATSLPFFVYHLSSVSPIAIGSREYTQRLLAVSNIAGMKITDRDLYTFGLIKAFTGDRLQLLSGADEVMCQAILCGAQGAIGTFYNLWGPACQRARAACAAGDVNAGQAFMLRFQCAIAAVLSSGSIWTFLRAAMRLKYGLEIGKPRPPLGAAECPWTDEDVRQLIEQVDSNP
ncbi:MAG: dihydrodipicolinate synthase family protein [Planctomycetes bacterium]|nr:dihydrodipicolinate synthase family protein [Planctomycetota bacterium]